MEEEMAITEPTPPAPDDLAVAPAGIADSRRLAHLIRTSFATVARRFDLTPDNCPKHPSNCSADWIRRDLERGVRYWLLTQAGRPVGCAALEHAADREGVGYLERLAVLPAHRGRGLGSRLLNHVLSVAVDDGLREASIGIIAAQTDLKEWYRRRGFTDGATRSFPHLPFEVALMVRCL
jgi:N-acetylglutamate synthase-like GNAT family acetyltransferase